MVKELLPTLLIIEPLKEVPIEKAINPKAIVETHLILSTYKNIGASLMPSKVKLLNNKPKTKGPIMIPVMI